MSSRSDVLKVGNVTYTYYPVNRVAGHEKLPFSLTVLLENILRNAESDERASFLVKSEAKSSSALREFFSRISPVYLSSLILR